MAWLGTQKQGRCLSHSSCGYVCEARSRSERGGKVPSCFSATRRAAKSSQQGLAARAGAVGPLCCSAAQPLLLLLAARTVCKDTRAAAVAADPAVRFKRCSCCGLYLTDRGVFAGSVARRHFCARQPRPSVCWGAGKMHGSDFSFSLQISVSWTLILHNLERPTFCLAAYGNTDYIIYGYSLPGQKRDLALFKVILMD